MYQSIDINKAAKYVKIIIDTTRCSICDKSNEKRMRYPCGHTSCEDCVLVVESCPFCLTPQDSSTFTTPSIDNPLTERSQKALALLEAFQTDFGIDVYRSNRISEKLKVEKELFPQCIQAPAKYYNKRKSEKKSTDNKENIAVFPGEEVSSFSKMENSNANVRKWLNTCVKRKPLGDLNHRNINTLPNQTQKVLNTQNKQEKSHKKRNYSEIWMDENDTFNNDNHKTPTKKHKVNSVKKIKKSENASTVTKKSNKDDSGIAVDDDDRVIVIDESQSVTVDKDMNAWLAVLEAEKAQGRSKTISSKNSHHTEVLYPIKVPFYKKSSLFENCEHCNNYYKAINENQSNQPNVSITVESKSFTAIINVSKAQKNETNAKQSVEVQTDFDLEFSGALFGAGKDEIIAPTSVTASNSTFDYDQFLGDAINSPEKIFNKTSNVIIAESDSDEDMEHSISLQVTADVHKSYDEMLVLGDIDDMEEHSKRPRRAARGNTPTSTDSSDKENYNPNRTKRSENSKKKPVKK